MSSLLIPSIGFHSDAGAGSHGVGFPVHITALHEEYKLTAVQIFASSPKSFYPCGWTDGTCVATRAACAASGVRLFIHAPYIINPSCWTGGVAVDGGDNADGERIKRLVVNLLQRAAAMGAEGVVIHVGKSLKLGEREGLRRMVEFCSAVLRETAASEKPAARLLIETCAGQGSEVARNLAIFGALIHTLVDRHGPAAIGVCVDTCHVFASGYTLDVLTDRVGALIGWEYVHLIHLNDSETECGACVDRHACIGYGKIGAAELGRFCRNATAAAPHLCFVFETPVITTVTSGADGEPVVETSRGREMKWFYDLFSSESAREV